MTWKKNPASSGGGGDFPREFGQWFGGAGRSQSAKPKVKSGLSIKKNPRKQRDWSDVKLTDRKERLTEKFLENHGYRHSDTPGKPDTYTYVGDKVKAYSEYVKGGKVGVSVKTFNNPTLKSLRNWMGY